MLNPVSNEPKMPQVQAPQFPPLNPTSNNLVDIIRWVHEGNIVITHTTSACRVFHALPDLDQQSLDQVRVLYVDCNSHPGLLDDGEWECYIKASGNDVKELGLKDKLRKIIAEQVSVPHKEYMSLGY